ncbi:hypothetical protein FQ192_24565 [Pseudomonas sp. ANT_J12]|nr:hypothetical protein FQ192_24565 [Pseudomonas sp. ANT_J12]
MVRELTTNAVFSGAVTPGIADTVWRGGLPPFGCEAVANLQKRCSRQKANGSASHPNGGKPPRHKGSVARDHCHILTRPTALSQYPALERPC